LFFTIIISGIGGAYQGLGGLAPPPNFCEQVIAD